MMSETRHKYSGDVIWYNEMKGYGFVHFPPDDVFLHHTILTRFGLHTVYPGDKLTVYLSKNECGIVIDDLIAIERTRPPSSSMASAVEDDEVKGVVKFFNTMKGYGFVSIDAKEQDVFVHLHVLRECGIQNLTEGQEILLRVIDEGKGPMATEVKLFIVPD